jgi:glycosyltransferase involved in cell wall biosynthesis
MEPSNPADIRTTSVNRANDRVNSTQIDMSDNLVELSVVMPCLNEVDTLGVCIDKALSAMREGQIEGEVIVADNGSNDGSIALATERGVRVVNIAPRGYGNALMGGIEAARGRFIIMGDADDSYDFLEIPKFVERLRDGNELVQGCRLPSGGGRVLKGAMPPLHRWLGNPLFSVLVRKMFRAPIHDVYCGMRGFTAGLYQRLDMRCTGMEFATEMIIKASLRHERIAEVPITLHPDGRQTHAPHLRTFRDGWRTLRFFLLCSPRWLFLMPGLTMIVLGLICSGLVMLHVHVGTMKLDAHSLLFASLSIMLGYQAVLFSILTKTFAVSEGLLPWDDRIKRFFRVFTLERGLAASVVTTLFGLLLLGVAVNEWRIADFGDLDYARTMRWVIPGVTLTAIGFQTVLFSFFTSILRMRRR